MVQIVGLLKIEAHVIWCLCGVIMELDGGFLEQSHSLFMVGARAGMKGLAEGVPENFSLHQVADVGLVTFPRKGFLLINDS